MPRGGGSSGRSSSGGGFSSHSRSSSSGRSSGHSSSYRSSSSRSSGYSSSSRSSPSRSSGFSSHERSGRSSAGRPSSYGGYGGGSNARRTTIGPGHGSNRYGSMHRTGRNRPSVFPLGTGQAWRRTPRNSRSAAQKLGRRSGCLGAILIFLIFILLIGSVSETGGSTTGSQHSRTPLSASDVLLSSEWYQDDWGDWIDACPADERTKMVEDFQYFFSRTGVQPYLWILGENGASIQNSEDLEQATRDRYDALFSDKGHLLIAFREYPNASGNYISGCFAGETAEQVMDAEAREVLLSNIDSCYDRTDYSEAQLFGAALRKTADAIMGSAMTTGEAIRTLLELGAVIFVFMLISFFRGRRKEQAAGREQEAINEAETQPVQTTPVNEPVGHDMAVKCPNCGANARIHVKTTGKCPYCGSYIYIDEAGNAKIAQV